MNNSFRVQNILRYGPECLFRTLLYPIPSTSRRASLTSAIDRGRRRSQGVGFRGKERPTEKPRDNRTTDARRDGGLVRRTADPPLRGARGNLTRESWRQENSLADRDEGGRRQRNRSEDRVGDAVRIRRGKRDVTATATRDRPRLSRAARFNDPNFRFGNKSLAKRGDKDLMDGDARLSRTRSFRNDDNRGFRAPPPFRPTRPGVVGRYRGFDDGNKGFKAPPPSRSTRPDVVGRHRGSDDGNRGFRAPSPFRSSHPDVIDHSEVSDEHRNHQRRIPSRREVVPSEDEGTQDRQPERSRDSHIPISIPYTTPASEFLFGTSAVEAAIISKRRKLYKLYIQSSENRLENNAARDGRMEKLAKGNGIPVHKVGGDGARFMDKMSKGRPHNGYLLEASPLPKLPIASLGEITNQNGNPGFAVVLDHQSREEADVNGTSNFIQLPQTGTDRNPLILFLDGIKDPGNLGSIIRSASFLGVTAIALCTYNAAGVSPVALKASAGAAEAITLLSVKNPRGFLTDSRRAGWKIYAAVPPPGEGGKRGWVPHVTTDQLDDGRLRKDPIILILGDEGEGIGQHLRSKADVEVGIASQGNAGNVDSLNVSVAAGVLIHALVRKGKREFKFWEKAGTEREGEEEDPAPAGRMERDLW